MKKGLIKAAFFIVLGLMLIAVKPVKAQCSLCSANVASNSSNGNTTTNGLNNGIMFLLAAPYLAVTIVGYIWYKKYRRKNVNIDIPKQKLHLN